MGRVKKYIIEVEEIDVRSREFYISDSYPHSGLYLVHPVDGKESGYRDDLVVVDTESDRALSLGGFEKAFTQKPVKKKKYIGVEEWLEESKKRKPTIYRWTDKDGNIKETAEFQGVSDTQEPGGDKFLADDFKFKPINGNEEELIKIISMLVKLIS